MGDTSDLTIILLLGLSLARSWRFGFAGLETGDRFGGGPRNLRYELIVVEDAEAGVGFLDGDNLARVSDLDLNFLTGGGDRCHDC